jgi:DHA1 family multidrug resistance protein-like MFS transporter
LIAGIVIISLGCAAITWVTSFTFFMCCVAIFQLGVLLTRPSQQTITANLADPHRLGTFMGFNSLALAIGGGLGNLGGGYLMDVALAFHIPWLPWLVFGTTGLLTAAALAVVLFPAGNGGEKHTN